MILKEAVSGIKKYGLGVTFSLVWYYIWGHILGAIFYDKKYYQGKWFCSRYHNLIAPGWKWICLSMKGRKYNPGVPWPCSEYTRVGKYQNIHFDPDDVNNFMGFGNYFQTMEDGQIYIGKGTYIASNVGIITTNHNIYNPDEHVDSKDVVIGKKCWIGMNSVILPGVILGNHTVVGAGAVVTKSFPDGNCVIGGNPAQIIRKISSEDLLSAIPMEGKQ